MSQYLSSFIIDPVVRQARRFSRPSFGARSASENGGALATASTTTNNVRTNIGLNTIDQHQAFGSNSEVVEDDEHNGSQSFHGHHHRLVEVENLEPTIRARQYIVQPAAAPLSHSHSVILPAPTQDSMYSQSSTSAMDTSDLITREATSSASTDESGEFLEASHMVSRSKGNTLPEDDGMSQMRRRILAIQRADSSNEIKARLIYGLMTEKHNASQRDIRIRAHSPASLQSSERPLTPASPKSWDSIPPTISPPTSSSSADDSANPFYLTPEDLKPTFWAKPSTAGKDSEAEKGIPKPGEDRPYGCSHYKRNIKLQCSACNKWYTCRFCHDEVEDHMLNRRETRMMLCMFCGGAQPAHDVCIFCLQVTAWYYCDVCKLWDDDPEKDIYHCDDCGICRIGKGLGKDFFHCMKCNVCMAIGLLDKHRCVERSTDCDCPICNEYMFTSPEAVVFMPCGHSIHKRCYCEHMRRSYKCPICSKSIANMERQFLALSRSIDAQPMPEEFRDTKALIYCNDCTSKTTVQYHWLGLKCAVCDSYNTVQLSLRTDRSRPPSPPSWFRSNHQDPLQQAPQRSHALRRAFPYLQQRAAASLPSLTNPFSTSLAFPPLIDRSGSNPTTPISATFGTTSSSGSDADDSMSSSSGTEGDGEYSEVDFWGGESPRLLSYASSPRIAAADIAADEENTEQESEDYDNEDDTDAMDDDEEEEETEEGGELPLVRMDIFGHR